MHMFNKLLKKLNSTEPETDLFIKRIRSLVIGEGMLRDGNIELFKHAIEHLPQDGHVIEIGSYGGLSTNLINYLLIKNNKPNMLYSCDAWIYEGYTDHLKPVADNYIDGRPDVLRTNYESYMKDAFIRATTWLSAHRLPHSFHMKSDIFFEYWKENKQATDVFGRTISLGGQISFAYVDGDHSYESAWKDFNHVDEFLVPKGFILLDDSADDQSFGSAKMMKEIKKDSRYKIVGKNPNYLIQKIA